MSSTRTQVYLTDSQREKIDALAENQGLTMAEIVRRALDAYLDTVAPDPGRALKLTFGTVPNISVPDRDEWDRG